jgi:Tat protein secretion system quality control protein TatD with DNase activity
MIIDGHAHACGESLTAEEIVRKLDENGVDKVVLVQVRLENIKRLLNTGIFDGAT